MKSAFIFGDVHGHSDQLSVLLKEMKERDPDAPIYSVGDLLDRGPDAKGVIELCVQANVQAVLGNHECWMQEFLNGKRLDSEFVTSKIMGGIHTLNAYGLRIEMSDPHLRAVVIANMPAAHQAFLKNLPIFRSFEIGSREVMIVHGGIPQDGPTRLMAALSAELGPDTIPPLAQIVDVLLRAQPNWKNALLWNAILQEKQYRHPGTILCYGHYPYPSVVLDHDAEKQSTVIGLDTGCGTARNRILSAVHLQEKETPEATIEATILGVLPASMSGGLIARWGKPVLLP